MSSDTKELVRQKSSAYFDILWKEFNSVEEHASALEKAMFELREAKSKHKTMMILSNDGSLLEENDE